MTALRIAAILAAAPAMAADPLPDCDAVAAMPGAVIQRAGGDRIIAAPNGSGAVWICYENSSATNSDSRRDAPLTVGDVEMTFSITIGSDDETFAVTPPPGWAVWPADAMPSLVKDGEQVTVMVFGGLS